MSEKIYTVHPASAALLPIVISIPHAGITIPSELSTKFKKSLVDDLPDTDWLVPELYSFCSEIGIPMIQSHMSRYVIDLNRPIDGPSLYDDQRRQTDAMPLTSFDGEDLYQPGQRPSQLERAERIEQYYIPYHTALGKLVETAKKHFGYAIVFDAHSIRRCVPSISDVPFPDMIIGDRDGTSSDPALSKCLREMLSQSPYQISYNQPFKGGQITRFFGNPSARIHALQLEMSQDIYLKSNQRQIDNTKAAPIRKLLRATLCALAALEGI